MQGYTGNADFATRADDLVAVRHGADVAGCERADAGFYSEGRYHGTGTDAQLRQRRAAEKAQREAERRAQHADWQREAAQAAALPAGVERGRLTAAAALTVRPLGPATYLVTGGRDAHHVDLAAEGAALLACTCGDAHYRPQFVCKHQLAVHLARGDAALRAALAARTPATRRAA